MKNLFVFDAETAKAENNGGNAGQKVLDSGVYDITINHVEPVTASTGTIGLNWNFTVDGAKYPNMIYNMWIAKANGETLFDYALLQHIMGIAGIKELTEVQKEVEVKDGTKTITVFKELQGVKCKAAIQKEFDFYNGEVREKNKFKEFFTTDGKTYAEYVAGKPAKQIKWYEEKMKDSYTKAYKAAEADGLIGEGASEEEEDEGGSLL